MAKKKTPFEKQVADLKRRRLARSEQYSLGDLSAALNVHRATMSRIESGFTKSAHPLFMREWERIVAARERKQTAA